MTSTAKPGKVDHLVDAAAAILGLSPKEVRTGTPRPEIREAWEALVFALWRVSEATTAEIGRALGGVDHARVIIVRDRVEERMKTDVLFRLGVSKAVEELRVAQF